MQKVANMRRKGDVEAEKALLADIYTSFWVTAPTASLSKPLSVRQKWLYTKDKDVVDRHLRSAYFEDLEEIGDAYKIESRKNNVTINRPFQVGIVVYQPGQVANVAVLLRLLGPLSRQARLRAYLDGHGQYVLRPFVRHS